MSLAQHVSSQEGPDRVDLASLYDAPDNASLQLGRRLSLTLSYDPLPRGEATVEKAEPVGAHQVSTAKRLAQVVVGVVICILASGIVFGFAALKEILIEEGVYRDLCTEDELRREERLCYMQDQRLNLNFIIGSVTTNLSALLVGSILDRYGPFPCGIVSCVVLFCGALCMTFASSLPFDAYPISFFLLALGGTFTFVPSFHLANAFLKYQGLILSLVTGAFDASAAVFLVFRLIYQSGALNLQQLFLLYLLVPVLMMIAYLTFMPRQSYETRAELESDMTRAIDYQQDVHDSDDDLSSAGDIFRVRSERAAERKKEVAQITELIGDQNQQVEHEIKEDEKKIASGVWGVLHGMPARQQLLTPWFILIALFTVLQMTRFNFFISTIWTQYEYLLGSRLRATEVNEFFDLALPIGGVVTVPFIGLLLDGTSTTTVLGLLVLLSTIIGVLGAMPNETAAYMNIILFCVFRPLYYSAMSDYAAKIFGFATFGTVYGTMICLSGLSLFSQPALQALVHSMYYEDPGPVNLWLAGAGFIFGLALVMYVDAKAREIRRNQYQFLAANAGVLDIDDERRSLLSVSVFDGNPGATLGRKRIDLRSPLIRPQDGTPIPHLNANLFYAYGGIGVGGAGLNDDATPTATPHGSLRVRGSRVALGAGLRTVTERDEPEESDPERHRTMYRSRQHRDFLSPDSRQEDETPVSSEADTTEDNVKTADDDDMNASQLSFGEPEVRDRK